MTAYRLKDERHTAMMALHQYSLENIAPLIQSNPALSSLKKWGNKSIEYDFECLIFSTLQALTNDHPEQTYQQLKNKISQGNLSYAEIRKIEEEIEEEIEQFNTVRSLANERVNQRKKKSYKAAKHNHKKDRLGHSKPDKAHYKSHKFNPHTSPFNKPHFFKMLEVAFQVLVENQQLQGFKSIPYFEEDTRQREQHRAINQTTQILERIHQEIQDKDDVLQAKERQLKQELVTLKHLTRLSRGYSNLPDESNLTSPAGKMAELEALLEQKRKGG